MSPESADYSAYDADGDGKISQQDIETSERLQRLEIEELKSDSQRKMCWFALWGMLLYPSLIVSSSFIGLDKAANILGDIAGVYFVAVAGVIATFFGTQVWAKK